MLATFVIFLREGIEASMIVAVLLAYLDRIGQRRHFRDVFVGVGAALVLATAGGVAAYLTIRSYTGSRVQTIFETATYLLAACILTYMTLWMRRHARTISSELRDRTAAALERNQRLGIGLLAFQAVGREGLETAVFTLAIVFATHSRLSLVGAAPGLVAAFMIAVGIYHLGRRVNLGRFFTWLGALLIVFAAGLVADIVENLQQLGWVTVLNQPLWDSNRVLSEDSSFGDVFHSLFGYAGQPTLLQVICYLTFVGLAVAAFSLTGRRGRAAGSPGKERAAVSGAASGTRPVIPPA